MKNIVCLIGSPRYHGNSATIARHFVKTAEGFGATARIVELNRLKYRGCQGCYACKQTHDHCILEDDLSDVLAAVHNADVLVLASPVYYGDITGQLKCFIDRTFSYLVPDYIVNPQRSRLSPKKLVFILSQAHPDQRQFADIFPRYEGFLKWMGFLECRLIRFCGSGTVETGPVPKAILQLAEEAAREMVI